MAEMIYRAQPSKQELKWELMRRNLESRRRRILDPDANISNITVKELIFSEPLFVRKCLMSLR